MMGQHWKSCRIGILSWLVGCQCFDLSTQFQVLCITLTSGTLPKRRQQRKIREVTVPCDYNCINIFEKPWNFITVTPMSERVRQLVNVEGLCVLQSMCVHCVQFVRSYLTWLLCSRSETVTISFRADQEKCVIVYGYPIIPGADY